MSKQTIKTRQLYKNQACLVSFVLTILSVQSQNLDTPPEHLIEKYDFPILETESEMLLLYSAVVAANHKMYLIPAYSKHVGVFHTIDNSFTRIDVWDQFKPQYRNPNKFSGGILAPNGKIYCVPYDADRIGVIDTNFDTFTVILLTYPSSVLVTYSEQWSGGVLAPNGLIVLCPRDQNFIGVLDYETDAFKFVLICGLICDSLKFRSSWVGENGLIYFTPFYRNKIGIYDADSEAFSTVDTLDDMGSVVYRQSPMIMNNTKILLFPIEGQYVGTYDIYEKNIENILISGLDLSSYSAYMHVPNSNLTYASPFGNTIGVLEMNSDATFTFSTIFSGWQINEDVVHFPAVLASNGGMYFISMMITSCTKIRILVEEKFCPLAHRNSVSSVSTTSSNSNAYSCKCNEGYTGGDNRECNVCSPGTYKLVTGSSPCLSCTAGEYLNSELTPVSCVECSVGKFSSQGAPACLDCQSGKYQENIGQLDCDLCLSGEFQPGTGLSTCEPCSEGKFSSRGASTCQDCQSGKYQENIGQLDCDLCSSGEFQPDTGMSTCELCQPGSFQPNTGMSNVANCTPCDSGRYSLGGVDYCTPCAVGKFNAAEGADEYDICPENTNTQNLQGSDEMADCVCNVGYTGTNTSCEACEAHSNSQGD